MGTCPVLKEKHSLIIVKALQALDVVLKIEPAHLQAFVDGELTFDEWLKQ